MSHFSLHLITEMQRGRYHDRIFNLEELSSERFRDLLSVPQGVEESDSFKSNTSHSTQMFLFSWTWLSKRDAGRGTAAPSVMAGRDSCAVMTAGPQHGGKKAGGTTLTHTPHHAIAQTREGPVAAFWSLAVICMHVHFHFHIVFIRDDGLCLYHPACYFQDLKMLIWHLFNQFYFAPAITQAPCWAVKTKW